MGVSGGVGIVDREGGAVPRSGSVFPVVIEGGVTSGVVARIAVAGRGSS